MLGVREGAAEDNSKDLAWILMEQRPFLRQRIGKELDWKGWRVARIPSTKAGVRTSLVP